MNPWLLFILIGVHFLVDYPLQGDFLAAGKGSFAKPHYGVPWWHCLTAHAWIHGLGVGLVTGWGQLAVCETILHWVIDYAKCRKWIGFNTDQFLHVACKVMWAAIVAGAAASEGGAA